MLTRRPDGSYDGEIREVKVHGSNYWRKVPKDVRLPAISEIFSRAKDILDREGRG